jgi:NADH-quinone oxidoreductase subunit N
MHFDLSRPGDLMAALGPDLVLIVGAMLLTLFAAWRPDSLRHQRRVGIASMILVLLTIAAVVWYWMQDFTTTRGVVAVDNFRWAADLVFLIGTLATLALAIDYNDREGITAPETHVLVLLATSGMMLLAGARDLMMVFLGIELMSVASYVLVGLNRRSARGAEGALKYFLLGAFASGFLLYGIALIYGATASTDLLVIGDRVLQYRLMSHPLLLAGMAMLVIGFGFKVAAAPFHMWAPDVYDGAPTPITAYLAATAKAAAFAAFLRVFFEALGWAHVEWHTPIWWLAALTMVAGNVIALAQRNIKRILAYSSIAHAGYILVLFTTGSFEIGAPAFAFYLFSYTLATMGAFGVVSAIGQAGERNLHTDDYAGLWHVRPALAVAMSVFMLALLGFPLFGGIGFFAKWYVIQAALQARSPQTNLAVVLVLTSVVSAGYYLYVVMVMFMKQRPAGALAPLRVGRVTGSVIGLTAALILLLGLVPSELLRWSRASIPHTPPATVESGQPVTSAFTR